MIIKPKREFSGTFELCGDKSITHRAIMLNSFIDGQAKITNALLSADSISTIDCARRLGAKIEVVGKNIYITGKSMLNDNVTLDCGNSGTTMRLLAGFLCAKNITCTLIGDDSLSKRPMQRVTSPLLKMGADIMTTNSSAPIFIKPSILKGIKYTMPVESAQVKSAILLAGLNSDGETVIKEKIKTRDHTERMLEVMGANISIYDNTIIIKKSELESKDIVVPSDISTASFFLALGALKGFVTVKDVGVNYTRAGILRVLKMFGARMNVFNKPGFMHEPVADISIAKSHLRGITLTKDIIPSVIDELPIIAVLAAFADGRTVVSGAEELKFKESDRLTSICQMIRNCGGIIEQTEDGFIIDGQEMLNGGTVDSFGDHRIAMSGAVLLTASEMGGNILGSDCVKISCPEFFSTIN